MASYPPVPSFAAAQRRETVTGLPNGELVTVSEELLGERTQLFQEFLDSQRCSTDGLEYKEKIMSMLRRGDSRLLVNLNDVRHFNVDYARGLLFEPLDYLAAFDKALSAMVEQQMPLEDIQDYYSVPLGKVFFHVGLDGAFGEFAVTPRSLSTRFLSKMISIEGIITTCLLVRPKLVKSVHYVEKKGVFVTRDYRDTMTSTSTALMQPGSNAYPTEDAEGNALSTEYGFCVYRDHQKVLLQEMPERAPPGQLPRSIDVLLTDDLVDKVKPGDRVQLVGVYKCLASVVNGQVPGHFRTVLIANAVRHLGRDSQQPILSDLDIQNIKKVAAREDVYEVVSRSVAPSICGLSFPKKAVLLMLLGGVEKNLQHTHLRGDINVLLVGDPSVAKSQLLRFVLNTAPLAIATTGRGSSGVGLTAAVLSDKETGERRLEAGAMVLADRGVVCIDEFDKMSDTDRVAIHEVMEQQTVTIAKAGIHLSLNARCSVLAAANPIWSQYRESATPQENIRLPDSLLSRFDLLFILLDTMNERLDRTIAKHVTAMHRYLAPGQEEGAVHSDKIAMGDEASSTLEAPIYDRRQLPRDDSDDEEDATEGESILHVSFLKKYLYYAKVRITPTLTLEACEAIRRYYNAFRIRKEQEQNMEKTLPVTPRTLETLIRLATAHAKLRLSVLVEERDAQVAEQLVRYCLYKEVSQKKKKKQKKEKKEPALEDLAIEDNEEESDFDDEFAFREAQPRTRRVRIDEDEKEEDHHDDDMEDEAVPGDDLIASGSMPPVAEVETQVRASLSRIRSQSSTGGDFLALETLLADLQQHAPFPITVDQVEAVLKHMEDNELLFYRDNTIIFV